MILLLKTIQGHFVMSQTESEVHYCPTLLVAYI